MRDVYNPQLPADGHTVVIYSLENLQLDADGFLYIDEVDLEGQKESVSERISNEFAMLLV